LSNEGILRAEIALVNVKQGARNQELET